MVENRQWSDRKVEVIIGNLLRLGVLIAATVVFAGGVLFLVRHGQAPADYRVFRGEPDDMRLLPGIVKSAFALRARAVIQFGLLLLIATPVVRVMFSVFAFAVERDRLYIVVALIVLATLIFSFVG